MQQAIINTVGESRRSAGVFPLFLKIEDSSLQPRGSSPLLIHKMKSPVVCVSKYYGNTRKVAQAIAEILDAQIADPKDVNPNALAEFDLVGFGSGIYFGKHDPILFELKEKLPGNGGKAFIFSTRGRNSFFEDKYHKPLREALTTKGFTVVGEFSCRGFSDYYRLFKLFGGVNKGHPTEKDQEKAKAFALKLKSE